MVELQRRARLGTHNCASCRYLGLRNLRHPGDNNIADIYCMADEAIDLQRYLGSLEWYFCANWTEIDSPQAVGVYEGLLRDDP